MSTQSERDLARLQAIVAELPTYLQSGALFSNVVLEGGAGPRQNYPISISGALALVQDLQASLGLSPEHRAEVDSLNARLQAVKRFYPDAWKQKLERELRSHSDALRWNAEDAAREHSEENLEDQGQQGRVDRMRRVLQAVGSDVDVTPYQRALDQAKGDDAGGED